MAAQGNGRLGVQSRDHGLLGPESVTWRVLSHPAVLEVGVGRSLFIQAFYPPIAAAARDLSTYRSRPQARIRNTLYYVAATAFGDVETAETAAARVRKVHARIRGFDPVTGRPYSAEEPQHQLVVHTSEWESFLVAYEAFGGGRLTSAETDRYYAEGVRIGQLLGTPAELIPSSAAETHRYLETLRPRLCLTEAGREFLDFFLAPPRRTDLLLMQLPLRLFGETVLALLPPHLLALARLERPRLASAFLRFGARAVAHGLTLPMLGETPGLVAPEAHRVKRSALREGAVRA